MTSIGGDDVGLRVRAAYAGFAVFGAFWGAWGASVPAVRDQAGLSDGELGTALLFVGAGALPAMPLTGRAVDRWGQRVTAVLLLLLGGAGVAVAVTARDFVSLSVGLAVLGASSGAADVAINAAAGSAQRVSARPVITRAHGVFSALVVAASLSTGLLRGAGFAVTTPFLLVAVAAGVASIAVLAADRTSRPQPADRGRSPKQGPAVVLRLPPLLVVGGLAALAFAVENAHQSWSAVYLGDVLSAQPAIAAAGPAVFAAVVGPDPIRRQRAQVRPRHRRLDRRRRCSRRRDHRGSNRHGGAYGPDRPRPRRAGTAVLFPTLLTLVAAHVEDAARGAATSVVTTVACTGFLAGPVYVGRWAAAVNLPGPCWPSPPSPGVLALLAWPTLRAITTRPEGWTTQRAERARP